MNAGRVHANIDLNAILYNMDSMHRNLKKGTKMAAVIKTNAYGHGAKEISEVLEPLDYLWGYAVATVDEAIELIKEGRKKPFLILGLAFEEQYEDIVSNNIRPAVCRFEMARKLSEIAVRQNKICYIHIKIDTGMSRIGYKVCRESAEEIARISKLPNIMIEGMFTHFARADEVDKTWAFEQLEQYKKMLSMVEELGVKVAIKHCSNSAGIVELEEANMDMVRAGITLYGLWPSDEVRKNIVDLKPVMSIQSRIAYIKLLEKGRSISYGGTYTADRDMLIATIPVGYGDGYSRGLSNKGYVLIRGQKAPICGRVCMDQFMVDVSHIDGVSEGDTVTLLGRDHNEVITMEELGEISGRFNYEFACLITDRVPRVYIR